MNKQQEAWLEEALQHWQEQGLLDADKAKALRNNLTPETSGRQQLARLFYIIAASCTVLAAAAIFINDKFLEKLRAYFALSHWAIALGCGVLGFLWFALLKRRRMLQEPALESWLLPGTFLWLTAILYASKELVPESPYNLFFGSGAALLLALAIRFRSSIHWVLFLIAGGAWYGGFSETHSSSGLFLGMNYPVRFAVLGASVLCVYAVTKRVGALSFAGNSTFHIGLTSFLAALWGASVFGDYGSLEAWSSVRQSTVLVYGLLFGIVAVACIIYGVRNGNSSARDYGVVFLLLNLYTRYFEFFWDALNKGLFFLVLAVSFGGVAWWLKRRTQDP